MSEIADVAVACLLCVVVVCLFWLGCEVRRIVSEHKRRMRRRTFMKPDYVTLLDVILREVDLWRSRRALRGELSKPRRGSNP